MNQPTRKEPPARCLYCGRVLPDWTPPPKGGPVTPLVCEAHEPMRVGELKEMDRQVELYKRKAEEAKKQGGQR